MIGAVPISTFDTSAHNRLIDDDRSRSEALLRTINSQLWFRFAGLTIEELSACPTPRRESLFAACRKLQDGPSECLLPSSLLTEALVSAYHQNPTAFNWKEVNVRWGVCEGAIRQPNFFADEQDAKDQNQFQRERRTIGKQEATRQRTATRPEVQNIFHKWGEAPPTTFNAAFSRLVNADGSQSLVAAAKRFYDPVIKADADPGLVRQFVEVCPPFRALVHAMFIPWFNNIVRQYGVGEELSAGSNDLFMSVYLPYCDLFVTAEKHGQQEKCLRTVADSAALETEVISYDAFCDSVLVTA
ncbi:MAG TPA: hypothetical protein VN950_07805 [Terriglobales bacterium]|nr:hypothetical protein [Terriglobales bacterium]